VGSPVSSRGESAELGEDGEGDRPLGGESIVDLSPVTGAYTTLFNTFTHSCIQSQRRISTRLAALLEMLRERGEEFLVRNDGFTLDFIEQRVASQSIPGQTIIDISPVLLFDQEEYEAHGKYTTLDHYTFKWRDGIMALALGLGMFYSLPTYLSW